MNEISELQNEFEGEFFVDEIVALVDIEIWFVLSTSFGCVGVFDIIEIGFILFFSLSFGRIFWSETCFKRKLTMKNYPWLVDWHRSAALHQIPNSDKGWPIDFSFLFQFNSDVFFFFSHNEAANDNDALLEEHERLSASLAALTRHFAHVQLRLHQVVSAPTIEDREVNTQKLVLFLC